MSTVSLKGARRSAPTRIVLHLNGRKRELLPTDRVIHLARIARVSHKLTGQPARLSCSGWDWGRKSQERTP